jgi:hypothetical protein
MIVKAACVVVTFFRFYTCTQVTWASLCYGMKPNAGWLGHLHPGHMGLALLWHETKCWMVVTLAPRSHGPRFVMA